jgi:hypothetical protein
VEELERQDAPILHHLRLSMLSYAAKHEGCFPMTLEDVLHVAPLPQSGSAEFEAIFKHMRYEGAEATLNSSKKWVVVKIMNSDGSWTGMSLDGKVSSWYE